MGRINVRCSPKRMTTFYNRLSVDQRKLVDVSLFGPLFKIPEKAAISTYLLTHIVKCYQGRGKFVFGGTTVTFSLKDVALILGLKIIEFPVNVPSKEQSTRSTFSDKFFRGKRQVHPPQILDIVEYVGKEGNGGLLSNIEFLQMSYIYALGSFLFPNWYYTIDGRFVRFVDDVQLVESYSWGKDVYNCILNSVKRCKDDYIAGVDRPTLYGCAYALQIWAYEHFPGVGSTLLGLKSPRILKWIFKESRKKKRNVEEVFNIKIIVDLIPLEEELSLLNGLVEEGENEEIRVVEGHQKREEKHKYTEATSKFFKEKVSKETGSDEKQEYPKVKVSTPRRKAVVRSTRSVMNQLQILPNEMRSMTKHIIELKSDVMELQSNVSQLESVVIDWETIRKQKQRAVKRLRTRFLDQHQEDPSVLVMVESMQKRQKENKEVKVEKENDEKMKDVDVDEEEVKENDKTEKTEKKEKEGAEEEDNRVGEEEEKWKGKEFNSKEEKKTDQGKEAKKKSKKLLSHLEMEVEISNHVATIKEVRQLANFFWSLKKDTYKDVLVNDVYGCKISVDTLMSLKIGNFLDNFAIDAYLQILRNMEDSMETKDAKSIFTDCYFENLLRTNMRQYEADIQKNERLRDKEEGIKANVYFDRQKPSTLLKQFCDKRRNLDAKDCQQMFSIIHNQQKSHWSLAVVYLRQREIDLLDPFFSSVPKRFYHETIKALGEHLPRLLYFHGDTEALCSPYYPWKVKALKEIPRQKNGCDCGMFVIKYIEHLIQGKPLEDIRHQDMDNYRMEVAFILAKHRPP